MNGSEHICFAIRTGNQDEDGREDSGILSTSNSLPAFLSSIGLEINDGSKGGSDHSNISTMH